MKLYAEGKLDVDLSALGMRLSPVYLYQGATHVAAFDAGTSILGPFYHEGARQILGDGKHMSHLFVTHSHWDHCGAMTYLKRAMPAMNICGHASLPNVFKRGSIVEMIRQYNQMLIDANSFEIEEDIDFRGADVDLLLGDGDCIDLGNAHCIAYETPGHTRDSMSYYIPEQGILFPGEVVGVPVGNNGEVVQVEFLSSYHDYMNSIQKLAALRPKIICMAHEWVFTDDDAVRYLEQSYQATIAYRAAIEGYLSEANGDIDAAVEWMTKKEYDETGIISQPRFAYVLNLKAQIKHIAELQ